MIDRHLTTKPSERSVEVPGSTFRAILAVVFCSGMGELVLNLIQRSCVVPCLVSLALAWASHVAALGSAWI
jgi:hypothetical protein